jgi:hypothetical protein
MTTTNRRIRIALLLTLCHCLCAAPSAAQQPAAAKPGKVEQEVLAAERARIGLAVKADTAALEKMLGDDLTYGHSDGRVDTKAQFLDALKSGDLKYESMEHANPTVRVFGNTAVITGLSNVKVKSRGQDLNLRLRFTCVWVKRDARWQMVAWQSTRLPQQ